MTRRQVGMAVSWVSDISRSSRDPAETPGCDGVAVRGFVTDCWKGRRGASVAARTPVVALAPGLPGGLRRDDERSSAADTGTNTDRQSRFPVRGRPRAAHAAVRRTRLGAGGTALLAAAGLLLAPAMLGSHGAYATWSATPTAAPPAVAAAAGEDCHARHKRNPRPDPALSVDAAKAARAVIVERRGPWT